MVILGIDPGTAITGYGIIRVVGNRFKPVTYGTVTTPAGLAMEKRLLMLHEQLGQIIDQWPWRNCFLIKISPQVSQWDRQEV